MASLTLKFLSIAMTTLAVSLPASASRCLRFYDEVYSVDNVTYGLQAFDAGIAQIKSHLLKAHKMSPEKKLSYYMSSDMRVTFFRLQSLSRIYEKAYDLPFFADKRAFFKKYEDLLGKVDLYDGLLKQVKPMQESGLIQYFETIRQEKVDLLFTALKEDGLLSDPEKKMDEVYQELVKFKKWKEPKKDLELHVKRLGKELSKLAENIKARTYTHDDIEMGLHELRRQIRWPLIHVQTLTRLTTYNKTGKLPPEVKKYFDEMMNENPKLLESGFLKMRESEIDDPIQIPFVPHAMLTEIVSKIGAQKDRAEADIFIDEAMTKLNFSASDRQRVESKLHDETGAAQKIDHKALSKFYQEKLEASGLLEFYVQQLEKFNSKK
ncbi:MAG: hypothetical protein JNL11_15470 [Bdellovibrionaceae bacterium]|nr:hypothetical protein [Pseudobdellovibrionaceae bacterium]